MSAETVCKVERLQDFLDAVSQLSLPDEFSTWYQVDVAAMLDGNTIICHEINSETGDSLLFMNRSIVLLSPAQAVVHHFPRNLVHCFVEDRRNNPDPNDPDLLFRAELFSISPTNEQLCWIRECSEERHIPSVQTNVSRWMKWLNCE